MKYHGGHSSNILQFRRRQAPRKQRKDAASYQFRIDAGIAANGLVDALQKDFTVLKRQGTRGRMPTLIIETAQQRGQIRAHLQAVVANEPAVR